MKRGSNIKITSIFMLIVIYSIIITVGTYAFLDYKATNDNIAGLAKCDLVNYEAYEINASDMLATTNYLEGAKTTVTLSYDNECDIYTLANIYIHTNDATTAPIETVSALKYKVFQGDEQISEGVISSKGDKIIATVPLTVIPTDYDVYLWIDSDASLGMFNDTNFSGYIFASSEQTSTLDGFLVRDLSYNTNNGVAYNQVDWDNDNGTITTDGVDDYVDCGLANYDFGDSITMITRVKFNEITSNILEFFGNWESAGGGFYIRSGTRFNLYINGSYHYVYSSNVVSINTWYTLVATYDGSNIKLYINGVLSATTSVTGTITKSSMPIYLGANPEIDGSLYNPGNVTFSDALLFDRVLTEDEILNNYSEEIVESKVDKTDLLLYYNFYDNSRYNLVTNGFLSTGDNTNFPSFTYGRDEFGGYLSYTGDSSKTLTSSEYISVDSSKKYFISLDAKSNNTTARYYGGFSEYDVDKKYISPSYVMYISNSLTTLKQDLNDGDTIVYLNDVSGFQVTSSTPTYQRGFIFWNYTDSTGYTYPELTYSRNVYRNLFTYDNINLTDNTITLTSPWSGGTYVAGTKLSQSSDGSTYNYSLFMNANVSTTWKTYSATIYGIQTGGYVSAYNKFRYGVKYIRPTILFNHSSTANSTLYIKNFIFKEVVS